MNDISENKDKDETKEINLDELFDGSINNTVVIDPVTNNEVLLKNKKPNILLIILLILAITVLIVYFINNKTKFGFETKDVAPKTTTTTTTIRTTSSNAGSEIERLLSGELMCTYTLNSELESQNVTYKLLIEENKLKISEFNYIAVSNTGTLSQVIEGLKGEYENFYINNVSNVDSKTTFEKIEKGFSFIVNTNYESEEYDNLVTEDNKTVLFVKPTKEDSIDKIKEKYETKGFKCSINTKIKE